MSVIPSGGAGLRARALASSDAEAAALAQSYRAALLAPVTAAALPSVRRKLSMLSRRPLADAALTEASACEEEVAAPPGTHGGTGAGGEVDGPNVETLETWRRAAMGLGRISLATAGSATFG